MNNAARDCSEVAAQRFMDSVTSSSTRALLMHSSTAVELLSASTPASGAAPDGCQAPAQCEASPVRLCLLPAGTEATLHSIDDDQARGLLRSLGVMGTCRLRVCQTGNPYVIQVRSTRIGISMRTAESVCVVPASSSAPTTALRA